MLSLKDKVGTSSGSYETEVTQNQVSHFYKALGTQASPERKHVAPPTFLTTFRRGEFLLLEKLGVALPTVLHAEQEYQYEEPLHAGDVVTFETFLTNVLEKQGRTSSMQFLTFETAVQSRRGSKKIPIGKSKTTIVVRVNTEKDSQKDPETDNEKEDRHDSRR